MQLLSAVFKSAGIDQAIDSKHRERSGASPASVSTRGVSSAWAWGGSSTGVEGATATSGVGDESCTLAARVSKDEEGRGGEVRVDELLFECGFPVEFHARMPPISAPSAPATMNNRDPEGITVSVHHGTVDRKGGEGTLIRTCPTPLLSHIGCANTGPNVCDGGALRCPRGGIGDSGTNPNLPTGNRIAFWEVNTGAKLLEAATAKRGIVYSP
ncbi:MAG: hypothetical protein QM784_18270 [Polyangiaceae bacterium]